MKVLKKLTQKKLKALFYYDPKTGIFKYKSKTAKRVHIDCVAGYLQQNGYYYISIKYKSYSVHRLAWLYTYGYFPENEIDHINRIKSDNRIINLRETSRQCNSRNCGLSNNNISGIKGVSWHKKCKQWQSYICVDQKIYYIGLYKSFDDAVCARLAAEQCLDWEGCDSNSSAYQYVQKMLNNRLA